MLKADNIHPDAVFMCIENYSIRTTSGITKGRVLNLVKGRSYLRTMTDKFIFLHDTDNPMRNKMPWLTHEEFKDIAARYLKEIKKISATG